MFESPEAFSVKLDSATYDLGGANTALGISTDTGAGHIVDDDQPTVSIAAGTPNPAAEGGTVTFAVSLTNPADHNVTVAYHLVNGTAVAGSDFSDAGGGTVTILAGQTIANITVNVINDNVFELPEAFTVKLDSATFDLGGANTALGISTDTGTGNIVDNDQPTVAIANGTPNPAAEGGTITFAVSLTNPADHNVTVAYHLVNGTAVAGSDFSDAGGGTVTILAGQTIANITVNVINDNVFELPEAFTVKLDSATFDLGGANTALGISTDTGTGNIVDNDQLTVAIANGTPNPAAEGGTITFAVSLTDPADHNVTVAYHLVNGTAVAGSDFSDAGGGTVTILAGQTIANITVNVTNDNVFELPEAFTVKLDSATFDLGGANTALGISTDTGTGNIVDNDQPTVAIANGTPNPAAEGGTITFAVSLTNPADHNVTVAYHLVNGTAIAGSDFSDAGGGTVTILAGQTIANITVNVTNDNVFESPEAFTVKLDSATYNQGDANQTALGISTDTGTGNIVDNDQPTVAIANGTPNPAIEGTNATITFTVSLTNPTDHAVTVAYHLVNGTAVGGSDFTDGSGGTVTIAANQTSTNITVNVTNDNVFELPEAFTVKLDSATYDLGGANTALPISGTGTAIGNIADNDDLGRSGWMVRGRLRKAPRPGTTR